MIRDKTIKPIIDFIAKNQPVKADIISNGLGLSRVIIHKYLKFALEQKLINRYGSVPYVYYALADKQGEGSLVVLNYKLQQLLNNNFLVYDVNGRELSGYKGFAQWCDRRALPTELQAKKFKNIIDHIDNLRDDCGLISIGISRFRKQVKKSYLDNLYYCDAYQLAQFGKSKLGSMAFYAKQSQSLNLIKRVGEITKGQLLCHIKKESYDSICFVPHSLRRSVQIMPELRKLWNIKLPEIILKKLYMGDVIIAQKSLKGLEQRIRNARETIFLELNKKRYKKVLLIDDFVGSGATLNESAKKIKDAGLATEVVGLALVGNIDLSYEVINEV